MKIKMLFLAALLGAAAMSVNAGVRFGISVALPLPAVVSAPMVCATPVTPAPVIVSMPAVYAAPATPAPAAIVQTVPPCPGANYVWVPGAWHYRTAYVTYEHNRDAGHDRNWHDGHGHDGYRR